MPHLDELVANAINAINKASNLVSLNDIRIKYFGRKGFFSLQTNVLRKLTVEQKRERGAVINKAKKQIRQALNARKFELENAILNVRLSEEAVDVSLPGRRFESGNFHPITNIINHIEDFFSALGFKIAIGPEIEETYYNFDALNIPPFHPSRAEHDTFWFDSTRLLRTQTSSVQIRIMENQNPPIKIISPGRVYRNDYDQIHTPMFHQIEGFVVDKNVNFKNLKGILYSFLCNFFEKEDLQINFRPSYFPFTEPSSEVDIMSKNGKWIEIIGCGLIHPNVLNNVGINPEVYSGFAFGMGVERLAMLRYGVSDLRTFFENDLRFLKQFK